MSWYGLYNILSDQAAEVDYYKGIPPMACPLDGQPLQNGPPNYANVLYCPYDGWQFPRDFDLSTQQGM